MVGRRRRTFTAAAVAVATVLLVSACGVRWETEPSPAPSPDATTVLRNLLADSESFVADAAEASTSPLAGRAVTSAEAHLTALGGVYVAYPGNTPTPSPSPEPLPSVAAAVADARDQAANVAAQTTDPDLAFIAASIELEWALIQWMAEADTANSADVGDATFEPATPPDATEVPDAALTELVLKHDEARFAYETLAAQEFGPDRDTALTRARFHGESADALATLVTLDPRTPLYQLRDADLTDPDARDALARSLELDLGWRYASLMDGATAADLPWLLEGAFDAYTAAGRTEGFTWDDIPTLPGITINSAATP